MTAAELLELIRREMFDTVEPYFFKDEELLGYIGEAYTMFVRQIGGVADFLSPATEVSISAGEAVSDLDPRILRITSAVRESDGGAIKIVNFTDMNFARGDDYGALRPVFRDNTPGIVRYMVIGMQRNKCKWVQVPVADDVAHLTCYRLPLESIARDGSNMESFDFNDINGVHVPFLAHWAKYRAYMKQDADVFDVPKAEEQRAIFMDYCATAKAEWERYKYKPREVMYGGI